MAQRILILTKDATLLQQLGSGFTRYGANVEVVQNGDTCAASAKAHPTALVLVSADALPPGEALILCKRFKSDSDLAKTPFVLMGGSQFTNMFASHQKLHRRADEYVKLPLAFDELMSKLEPLVALGGSRG